MSKVFIQSCNTYNQKEVDVVVCNILKKANISALIKNKKILLEPNVLLSAPPEKCITTHPAILEAVIKVLKKSATKIIVGDSPFSDNPQSAYKITGIYDVCKRQKVELVNLASGKYYQFSNSKILKGIKMTKYLKEVDMVINIPKVKCHRQMYFTGAMKGIFSLVTGHRKGMLHIKSGTDDNLGEAILDIFNFVNPRLSIFDAVYGLEGNGPGTSGTRKFAGFISCSTNPIALDYATIKLLGLNPNKAALLRAAKRRGQLDEKNIEIIGNFMSIMVKFKEPEMVSVDMMPKFITLLRERYSDLEEVVIS